MRVNTTREKLSRGETVVGCGLQCYRSPEIARTFAAAGFDYVFIDMEHGSYRPGDGSGHDRRRQRIRHHSHRSRRRTPLLACGAACWIRARRASFCRAWKIPRFWKKR